MESSLQQFNRSLKSFHLETSVAVTLFNLEGDCIAFSGGGRDFCRYMKFNTSLCRGCAKCDARAMELCREDGKIHEYMCHAGIWEVVGPLFGKSGTIVGFLIGGKYLHRSTPEISWQKMMQAIAHLEKPDRERAACAFHNLPALGEEEVRKTLAVFERTVEALSATDYIESLCNEEVTHSIGVIKSNANNGCRTTCEALCKALHRSIHSLEAFYLKYCGELPARFIAERTMTLSEDSLMNTRRRVADIASDLGYERSAFIAFFKRECGFSPAVFRQFEDKWDKALAKICEENSRNFDATLPFSR